jgi:hypothetical protein
MSPLSLTNGRVSVGIFWMFCSAACVGVYPVIEGRHTLVRTFKAIYNDLTGKKKPGFNVGQVVGDTGTSTPTEKFEPDKPY